LDDIELAGQLAMRVVRADVPHARIVSIDVAEAQHAAGVHLVLTAADLEGPRVIPLRTDYYAKQFPHLGEHCHPVLAQDRVCYVGQPVVAVVADDPYVAEDAAELVRIEYEELPVVLDAAAALDDEAPLLHPPASNEGARFERRYGDVDAAFDKAEHHVVAEFRVGRHAGVPLEPRGCIADYDAGRDQLSLWGAVHVHNTRDLLADMLEMPRSSVRFRQCDIGGSFGSRGGLYPEYVLVAHASRALKRPVKWVEDRRENLVATSHAREQTHRIEGAFDSNGRILAIRDEIWHDKGAYYRQSGPLVSDITVGMICGPYRVPAYHGVIHSVTTNKTPMTAYRAPGRFEGTFARERLLDHAAIQIGLPSDELRRVNLLTHEDLPWEPGIEIASESFRFDSGDVLAHYDKALSQIGYSDWRREAEALRNAGRCVGTGLGVYLDKAGLGVYETATVWVDPRGRVRVTTGAQSVGQGLETILAQIVADELTLTPQDVEVVYGDTDLVPDGVGSWSSRSTVIAGGAALDAARKTVQKALRVAADLLEVSPNDLVLESGRIHVAGSSEPSLSIWQIADEWAGPRARLAGDEPGLGAAATYIDGHMNYPYGVAAVMLEIDPELGRLVFHRYATSCEAGRVINPEATRGQVIGAAVQGIGGALFEDFLYSQDGQPLATTFIDYLLPTAVDVPSIDVFVTEDAPTPDNPLRAKGIGEVGVIAAGAAIASAVDDALGARGVARKLPLTPQQIYALTAGRAKLEELQE
jgi:carbon-monoxide dehydrogenase large subunit/6-hydroxypseudooxynicotine dehydrogenase subunit gamma